MEMSFNSTESISFIHIKTNPAVLRSFLQKHLFQSDFFHYFMLPSHPRPHLCCSQVQTSLPGRFCFHCCHTYNARRTRLWADKTCCSRNRSSARRSWPGSGIQTGLRGRCASASAIAGWGWSCQNERLFLSTSHLHLKRRGKKEAQAVVLVNFKVKEREILIFLFGSFEFHQMFGPERRKQKHPNISGMQHPTLRFWLLHFAPRA